MAGGADRHTLPEAGLCTRWTFVMCPPLPCADGAWLIMRVTMACRCGRKVMLPDQFYVDSAGLRGLGLAAL